MLQRAAVYAIDRQLSPLRQLTSEVLQNSVIKSYPDSVARFAKADNIWIYVDERIPHDGSESKYFEGLILSIRSHRSRLSHTSTYSPDPDYICIPFTSLPCPLIPVSSLVPLPSAIATPPSKKSMTSSRFSKLMASPALTLQVSIPSPILAGNSLR